MTKQRLFQIALLIWLACFVASFVVAWLTPARDFGFTAGLNRITTFLGWQFVASVLALGLWTYGRTLEKGSTGRRLSVVPAGFGLVLVVGLVGVVLWVSLTKPPPEPAVTPTPVTKPTSP
ncbi:MAG TPA: hypothetical protein ENK28_10105 [Aliiroseovarius sp.]|nr:hypothetical protein [Aliiroseovarius sp.]